MDATVPLKDVAAVIGVAMNRARELVNDGTLPKVSHGEYDLAACVQAYITYCVDRVGGHSQAAVSIARKRLLDQQADKATLENQRLRGEIVKVAEVASLWAKLVTETRTRVMSLPTVVAPLVVACASAAEVQALLREHVHESLSSLTVEAGVLVAPEAAAEADDIAVGRPAPKAKSGGKRGAGAVAHRAGRVSA